MKFSCRPRKRWDTLPIIIILCISEGGGLQIVRNSLIGSVKGGLLANKDKDNLYNSVSNAGVDCKRKEMG